MATYQITKTSGENPGGNLSYRRISYDRSPRVGGKLDLRQNRLELWDERVQKIQPVWLAQPGSGMITRCGTDSPKSGYIRDLFGYKDAYYRVYSKFRERVWADSKAALAVEVGERKETISMLTEALSTLAKAGVLVARGRFLQAARTLGMYFKPRGVSKKDTFLNNWMRYRYGFVPLMGGITAHMERVERPAFIFAKATTTRPIVWSGANAQFYETTSKVYGTMSLTLKGRCTVTSSTLVKLRDLGLVNPLSVAFELISKSFVVGWFLRVGEWLDSFTDFVGLSFSDLAITETYRGDEHISNKRKYTTGGKTIWPGPWVILTSKSKRRVRLAKPPVPDMTLGTGLNLNRAIDSVALLNNMFKKR